MRWIFVGPYACLAIVASFSGCERAAPPPVPSSPSAPPVSALPAIPVPTPGAITLEQTFSFEDDVVEFIGTGFLAKTPRGTVVVVSSAHFLDFDGPRLKSVAHLTTDLELVCVSKRAFGLPGNGGSVEGTKMDLTSDYFVMEPEAAPTGGVVCELDPRLKPILGERVLLPYTLDGTAAMPERMVGGAVQESSELYSVVRLDEVLDVQGASGSPIFSQATGRVIGTLSRGGKVDGKTAIFIAPASGVLAAMEAAEQSGSRPLLSECVGKQR